MELKYFLNFVGSIIFLLCVHLFFKAKNIKWLPFGMAVDVRFDASSVNEEGSNIAWICEKEADGSDLGTPDTWVLLPGRVDSDIKYGRKNTARISESGNAFGVKRGENPAMLTITFSQDDDKTENFLKKLKAGHNYAILMLRGISHKDTSTNKLFEKISYFPILSLPDYYESKAPGRTPVLEATIIENAAAITFSSVSTAITDFIAKGELDGTAGAAFSITCAKKEGYATSSCKKTF